MGRQPRSRSSVTRDPGIALFMGGETTQPSRRPKRGYGLRLKAQVLRMSLADSAQCRTYCCVHAGAHHPDGANSGVQRHHSVDQQLCRWLLRSDRLSSNELVMTQELIANMLVCAAKALPKLRGSCGRGLIRYRRGMITVLDRPGLESAPASATRWSRRNSIVFCST